MWLCFNNSFVSVVESDRDPTKFNVRARRREHLVNLLGPDAKIVEGVGTDYRWRAFIDKLTFAELVKEKLLNIDYSNFKNSVIDDELHDLYSDFWSLHYDYQQFPATQPRKHWKKK